jgi:hypothetical protein
VNRNVAKDETAWLCPSAPPREGALLLGRFNAGGRLAFAMTPLPVTNEFLAAAAEGGEVGKRFRFTARCMNDACSRWVDHQCLVGKAAAAVAGQCEESAVLPACPIRSQCRWFAQEGGVACRACPEVVYDMRSTKEAGSP